MEILNFIFYTVVKNFQATDPNTLFKSEIKRTQITYYLTAFTYIIYYNYDNNKIDTTSSNLT